MAVGDPTTYLVPGRHVLYMWNKTCTPRGLPRTTTPPKKNARHGMAWHGTYVTYRKYPKAQQLFTRTTTLTPTLKNTYTQSSAHTNRTPLEILALAWWEPPPSPGKRPTPSPPPRWRGERPMAAVVGPPPAAALEEAFVLRHHRHRRRPHPLLLLLFRPRRHHRLLYSCRSLPWIFSSDYWCPAVVEAYFFLL